MEELNLLKDVFIANGYPEKLVTETIKQSWESETLKAIINEAGDVVIEEKTEYYDILHAPYIQGFSEGLQKKLRRFNIGYAPKKGKTLYDFLCHLKPKIPKENEKDVVYAIPCQNCKMHYVGETSQHFCDRRKQHARDVVNKKETNGIYCHIKTHSSHQPDWDNFKFIDREKNWKSRKIKESLYINALNPTDFMDNVMNIEKGIAVNDCWMEFNTEIRGSIKKKMEKKSNRRG